MMATASRKNSLTSIKSAAKQVLMANKLANNNPKANNNFTGRQSNASSKQAFEGGAPEMRAVSAL